jgi:hypothetical protein
VANVLTKRYAGVPGWLWGVGGYIGLVLYSERRTRRPVGTDDRTPAVATRRGEVPRDRGGVPFTA